LVKTEPQCAHWAIFRTAQLLGIPTESGEIQHLLPNQPKGHSLAQVVETLAKIGVDVEAYRNDWDSLSKKSFPCIVHLKEPEHYIVVSGIEPERGYVHIFDDAGNRTRQRRELFEQRWTGYTLHVKKNVDFFVAKIKDDKPQILFDHLTIDKGDIPAIGEPTEFVFPIRNLGKSNLVIEDIKVSCGCLKSEKREK
jgi:ABC-type bacteriocin/lantibiotic exporter with double-glycine peptidase domain